MPSLEVIRQALDAEVPQNSNQEPTIDVLWPALFDPIDPSSGTYGQREGALSPHQGIEEESHLQEGLLSSLREERLQMLRETQDGNRGQKVRLRLCVATCIVAFVAVFGLLLAVMASLR